MSEDVFYSPYEGTGALSGIQAIEFTGVPGEPENLFAEYLINGSRLQFHIWPNQEMKGTFAKDTETTLKKWLAGMPGVVIDYVPEVNSWYAEIAVNPVMINDVYAKHIVDKLYKYGEER